MKLENKLIEWYSCIKISVKKLDSTRPRHNATNQTNWIMHLWMGLCKKYAQSFLKFLKSSINQHFIKLNSCIKDLIEISSIFINTFEVALPNKLTQIKISTKAMATQIVQ